MKVIKLIAWSYAVGLLLINYFHNKNIKKIITFLNRITFYGYFIGLFNLVLCLSPYPLIDYYLIFPAFIWFIFPLGSLEGIIPYGFFRWGTPISYLKLFGSLPDNFVPYYIFLMLAICLQIYVILQIIKDKINKIYNIILLHHLSAGLFYFANFVIFPLLLNDITLSKILFGSYGLLLNILVVISLRREFGREKSKKGGK